MIRLATVDDIPQMLAVINGQPGKLLPRTDAEIRELLRTFWVAEEQGKIIGTVCLEIYSTKIAELRSLAVHPDFKGRGNGAKLVEQAIAEAKKRNIPQVLAVTSNIDFFQSQGFGSCLNEKFALFWMGDEVSK